MGNLKNIPKLRFPEFANSGEWKETKLGKVLLIGSGKDYKHLKEGRIPVYGSGGYMLSVDEYLYDGESVGIGRKGTINNPMFLTGKFWTVDTLFYTHSFKNVSPFFVYLIFQNINWLSYNEAGGVPSLSKKIIEKIPVLIPFGKEQQKIADCLSSLDDLITAHKEKLDVLKEHKKGLLQNLFPQEGEKVPKYRFPEFENDGDWEEKKLKSLGKFQGGGTPSKKKKNYWVGDIPWISSSDVYDNDIFNISITRYINEESIQNSATKLIPENSVLFVSRVGVGKFVVNEKPVCTSQDFTNFTPKKINSYFVAYSFLANKNKLVALVQGTSIKGFTTKDLKKTEMLVPNKLTEQQKIAETLSSFDSIIEQQQEKIEKLEEHKKGLLQGLFPEMKN